MSIQLEAISYKDQAGFVIKKKQGYVRYIAHNYAKEYDHLINSGLYQVLVNEKLLLSHDEIEDDSSNNEFYKILFPTQISFISFPFEWTYSQWQEMVQTFIVINEKALQYGMILKDASPYNFIFFQGKCLLLDTISFDFFKNGDPWIAYRQFCEEILSPIALMTYKGSVWSKLSRSHISGLSLSFVSKALPIASWFNSACLFHIHLHSKFQKKKDAIVGNQSGFTTLKLATLLGLLKNSIRTWRLPSDDVSIWNQYYENDIADTKYLDDKVAIVSQWLFEANTKTIIDLGANTGKFSVIAASFSKEVIALENDIACVEKMQSNFLQMGIKNITTVVADITQASPGLGWANKEKKALLERLTGDMIMMLALVHHLCITKNIPLQFVAQLAASTTSRYAIVEFIPKTDSKTKILLQHRGDIFKNYTEDYFINCFSEYFTLIKVHHLEASDRKLFLWEKK